MLGGAISNGAALESSDSKGTGIRVTATTLAK